MIAELSHHPYNLLQVPKMRTNEPYAENPDEQRIVEEVIQKYTNVTFYSF